MRRNFNLIVKNKNFDTFLNCFDFESLTNSPISNVLEVRISHHHNLVVTALKDQFIKGNVKIKFSHDYKLFDIEALK